MTTFTGSSTASSSGRFSPSAAMGGRRVLLPYLGSVAVVAVLVIIAVLFFGSVQGVEFSPSHFELREFSYWEIPLLRLQVSPIDRSVITIPIANQLMTGQPALVQRAAGVAADWDLVSVARGGQSQPGDAQLLVDFLLDQPPTTRRSRWYHWPTATNNTYWSTWTSAHPAYAAKLWPRVQQLARRKQYLWIPDLFRLAANATAPDTSVSVAEFEKSLNQFLAALPQSP